MNPQCLRAVAPDESDSSEIDSDPRDVEAAPGDSAAAREAAALAVELEGASARRVLVTALERFPSSLALFTSFQAEGMVLLDLVAKLGAEIPVLSLDTGRLPPETYDHIDRVRQHYGIEVELVFPDAVEVQEMVRRRGPNLFYASVDARLECCRVRKVEPLRRALGPYAAWITGLRRDQTQDRARIAKVALDPLNAPDRPLFKLSPLADWTHDDVWSYIREHRVPYHPLYDRGYLSIGCAPCTRPTRPAEDPRAGRWWWEQEGSRECGLHVLHRPAAAPSTAVAPAPESQS